jgi:hypothetical protein
LSFDRLFAVQRASASLESRRLKTGRRTEAMRKLRRQVAASKADSPDLLVLLDHALQEERRSVDRAIIHAYLAAMPSAHANFPLLRQAAETAADRHAWSWRDIGRRLALWSPVRDGAGAWCLPQATRDELARHMSGGGSLDPRA